MSFGGVGWGGCLPTKENTRIFQEKLDNQVMCVKLAQGICISEDYNFVVAVLAAVLTRSVFFSSSNLRTLLEG